MRRPFLTWYVAGIALVASTLVPNQWVQVHWGIRFMFVGVAAITGLPYLAALVLPEHQPSRQARANSRERRRKTTSRTNRPAGKSSARPDRGAVAAKSPSGAALRAEGSEKPSSYSPASKGTPDASAQEGVNRRRRLAAGFGAGFAGWAVLSALVSGHAAVSFLGQYVPATGALFTVACIALWATGACAGRDAAEFVEYGLLIGLGLNVLVALLQSVVDLSSIELGNFSGRAPGLFANPVYLSPFIVGGFWLVVHRFGREPVRWGVPAALVAAAVEVSGSRFALGLLVLAGGLAFTVVGPRLGAVLAGLVVVGLAIGAVLAHAGGTTTSSARAVEGTSSGLRPRFETWKEAPKEVLRRPIFGYGPDEFRLASGPDRTLAMALTEGTEKMFPDAHNIVVEDAVTLGIPGLALFLAFVGFALRIVRWETPLAGFGALGLAMHLVEPRHVTATPLVFLALGVAGAARWPRAPALPDPTPAVAGVAVAGLAFVPVFGTAHLNHRSHDFQTVQSDNKEARHTLGSWAVPFVHTANTDVIAARSDPRQAKRFLEDARRRLVEAASREPDDPANWTLLAEVDEGTGRPDDAVAEFRRALQDDPWSVDVMQRLGRLLEREGRQAEVAQIIDRLRLVHATLTP